jgi:hypothetical protein
VVGAATVLHRRDGRQPWPCRSPGSWRLLSPRRSSPASQRGIALRLTRHRRSLAPMALHPRPPHRRPGVAQRNSLAPQSGQPLTKPPSRAFDSHCAPQPSALPFRDAHRQPPKRPAHASELRPESRQESCRTWPFAREAKNGETSIRDAAGRNDMHRVLAEACDAQIRGHRVSRLSRDRPSGPSPRTISVAQRPEDPLQIEVRMRRARGSVSATKALQMRHFSTFQRARGRWFAPSRAHQEVPLIADFAARGDSEISRAMLSCERAAGRRERYPPE